MHRCAITVKERQQRGVMVLLDFTFPLVSMLCLTEKQTVSGPKSVVMSVESSLPLKKPVRVKMPQIKLVLHKR